MKATTGLRGVAFAVALTLVSCGEGEVANPASVFCEEQGGSVEIVADAEGNQMGMCRLPDGTEVDEWEYYRQYHEEGGGAGLANPAAVFCEEQGGTVTGPEPMCELLDGTVVDAWDYYRTESLTTGD
jgi:putative hemolysin